MIKLTKNIEIPIVTLLLGILFIIIQLVTGPNYPIFRDELYYIDCANHPAFGYVDQPPLSIWLLTVWKFIFGDSLISLRIIPALCGAMLIILTSLLTKEFFSPVGQTFLPVVRDISLKSSSDKNVRPTDHLTGTEVSRSAKLAQIFSSVTVFSGLYYLAIGGFYSMNAFDSVFWALLFLILIRIINQRPLPKGEGYEGHLPPFPPMRDVAGGDKEGGLWLLFGIIAGLGLMNKISVGYLGLGIFIAILLTKNRVWLKQKHIWLGGVVALAIFSPYVIWNMFNDYATIEFIQNAQRYKIAAMSPLDFLKEQVLLINPLSAPVWIAGLIALIFIKKLRSYRIIGITYIVILVLLIIARSKPYYLAAVYPVLIAAGAVVLCRPHPGAFVIPAKAGIQTEESLITPHPRSTIGAASPLQNGEGGRHYLKTYILYAYSILLLISMVVFSPMVIPSLPPDKAAAHLQWLGIMPSSGERNRQSELPQILADRFGWEEMTEKVAKIYNSLPEAEKKYTTIYAQNYGEAGAVNYYGRKYSLPRCVSGHNTHWLWGPPEDSVSTIIIIGGDIEDERQTFNEVNLMDSTYNPYAMPFENGKPIFLCRGFKKPLKEIWNSVKFYI